MDICLLRREIMRTMLTQNDEVMKQNRLFRHDSTKCARCHFALTDLDTENIQGSCVCVCVCQRAVAKRSLKLHYIEMAGSLCFVPLH